MKIVIKELTGYIGNMDVYYFGDQFGCQFIRIISMDDNIVAFYKCISLSHICREPDNFLYNPDGKFKFICEKSKMKNKSFNKAFHSFLFNKESKSAPFRGSIKISDKDIFKILNIQRPHIDLPFVTFDGDNIIAKKMTEEDFRNIKLDMILD